MIAGIALNFVSEGADHGCLRVVCHHHHRCLITAKLLIDRRLRISKVGWQIEMGNLPTCDVQTNEVHLRCETTQENESANCQIIVHDLVKLFDAYQRLAYHVYHGGSPDEKLLLQSRMVSMAFDFLQVMSSRFTIDVAILRHVWDGLFQHLRDGYIDGSPIKICPTQWMYERDDVGRATVRMDAKDRLRLFRTNPWLDERTEGCLSVERLSPCNEPIVVRKSNPSPVDMVNLWGRGCIEPEAWNDVTIDSRYFSRMDGFLSQHSHGSFNVLWALQKEIAKEIILDDGIEFEITYLSSTSSDVVASIPVLARGLVDAKERNTPVHIAVMNEAYASGRNVALGTVSKARLCLPPKCDVNFDVECLCFSVFKMCFPPCNICLQAKA